MADREKKVEEKSAQDKESKPQHRRCQIKDRRKPKDKRHLTPDTWHRISSVLKTGYINKNVWSKYSSAQVITQQNDFKANQLIKQTPALFTKVRKCGSEAMDTCWIAGVTSQQSKPARDWKPRNNQRSNRLANETGTKTQFTTFTNSKKIGEKWQNESKSYKPKLQTDWQPLFRHPKNYLRNVTVSTHANTSISVINGDVTNTSHHSTR